VIGGVGLLLGTIVGSETKAATWAMRALSLPSRSASRSDRGGDRTTRIVINDENRYQ
jgi:hypothetical protein